MFCQNLRGKKNTVAFWKNIALSMIIMKIEVCILLIIFLNKLIK